MHGFGETGNATNKDTCYTLDKVTTYTNLIADGMEIITRLLTLLLRRSNYTSIWK